MSFVCFCLINQTCLPDSGGRGHHEEMEKEIAMAFGLEDVPREPADSESHVA